MKGRVPDYWPEGSEGVELLRRLNERKENMYHAWYWGGVIRRAWVHESLRDAPPAVDAELRTMEDRLKYEERNIRFDVDCAFETARNARSFGFDQQARQIIGMLEDPAERAFGFMRFYRLGDEPSLELAAEALQEAQGQTQPEERIWVE